MILQYNRNSIIKKTDERVIKVGIFDNVYFDYISIYFFSFS
jgi:hypothetical protein